MNLAELRLFKPLPACLWVLSILPFSHLFFRFYSTTDKRRKKKGKKKNEQGISRVFRHSAPGGKHESTISFIASWVSIQTSSVYPVTFVVLRFGTESLSPSLFQMHTLKSFTGQAFCSYFSIFCSAGFLPMRLGHTRAQAAQILVSYWHFLKG